MKIKAKIKAISVVLTGIFFVMNVALPALSYENVTVKVAGQEVSYEVAQQFKTQFLNYLADSYNKLSAMSESQIREAFVTDFTAQQNRMIETVSRSELDKSTITEVVATIQNRMTEMKEKISSLSKTQILESILRNQEEVSHLGAAHVLKGAVALLATMGLFVVLVAGGAIVSVGVVLTIATLGLLAPITIFPILLGVAMIAAGLVGIGGVWYWASEDEGW